MTDGKKRTIAEDFDVTFVEHEVTPDGVKEVGRVEHKADAPERTPLSERIRWDNCICGKGNPNGIGQSGDDWDLDTQCAYCDDADEVAALEQGRVDLLRRNQLLRDRDGEMQMAVDKGIRFEAEVERLRTAIRRGHTIEKEPDGTVVIYGTPLDDDPGHNCDEMGCPSTRHVLLVLRALTKLGEE
jgi:hypothetical protein